LGGCENLAGTRRVRAREIPYIGDLSLAPPLQNLADGENGMAELTPTQRTLRALRARGLECAIVEKWNQYAGPHGVRQDLFGIIDVIALDPVAGVIGVQSCGNSFSDHFRKITGERAVETRKWLETPGTALELWSWRKVKMKRGGVAMRWEPRVRQITLADLGGNAEDLLA
jgi:hypothetical protein